MLSCFCMLQFCSVIRRQQQVARCFFYSNSSLDGRMLEAQVGSDVDPEAVLKIITPSLSFNTHKGQAGKVAVIGGCREYTGAPYFAAISALKTGADLSHVFCTDDAAPVIKGYSPELIVHPSLTLHAERKVIVNGVIHWIAKFDCIVVGPGLGRNPFLLDCVLEIIKEAKKSNIPFVIDGDGLLLITRDNDVFRNYPLAVLTPNVNEYRRLVETNLNCEVSNNDPCTQLLSLAKSIGGVSILRKGKIDLISDGETVKSVSTYGSPRRCGGQGDVLAGSVAAFLAWARQADLSDGAISHISKNPSLLASIAGSVLTRKAALTAFQKKKRSTLTTDIIECLGQSMEEMCPSLKE